MNIRWQTIGFIAVILVSLVLTRVGERGVAPAAVQAGIQGAVDQVDISSDVEVSGAKEEKAFQEYGIRPFVRDWDVLDPKVSSQGVLIQSLDESFPLYHHQTYKVWPAASLTKLLTAVIVLEEIGEDKKIEITERSVFTEGVAGDLSYGEIYSARDLLKIMLLASSNDAATAFEDHVGGVDEFTRLMGRKARELGMTTSVFYDASGVSDFNSTSASDMARLVRYILDEHPQILQWSRNPTFLVQPINSVDSNLIYNIHPFIEDTRFVGGKTGTSPKAGENLVSIFTLGKQRVLLILLGSRDRVQETEQLLWWVDQAYGL